ncbi:MAG: zinc-binding dehydrogenase, partial [Actinomycetota bacterium]
AVTRVHAGDRVVGSFLIPCGECWWCRRKEYNNCNNVSWRVLGYGSFFGDLQGAQAEKARVPMADLTLLAIGEELPDEQAVFVGDSLATAHYAASLAGIGEGDTVAVIGCGPVGLLTLQCCRRYRPGQLVALDSVPERLVAAQGLGAIPIDVSRRNPIVAVAERTEQRGADAAIDCVGAESAFRSGLDMVRAGGHLVVVGVYVELEYPFPLGEAWRKNLRMTFSGVTPVMRIWGDVLAAVREGELDPAAIVSHTLPLEEAEKGYELFDSRRATQVVLRP